VRVLVTGATGFIGGRLVPALLDTGHDVTALVRDAASYDAPDGVDVVEADLLDAASLDRVPWRDLDAAYYLVHSMDAGDDFAERDRTAAEQFADAATDLDRVVYLGGLGAADDELSHHLDSRRAVEAVLASGDYDLTVLRAAIVVGAGSAGFQMVHDMVRLLPVMTTPRWVRTPCQPIAVDDAVAYLVGVLEAPEAAGATYEIGGPEVLTYEEMIRRTADAMGKHPLILPVPVLSPGLSAYWVDLVTDVPRSTAHALIGGLKNPVVVEDDSIRDVVDVDLTPFDEAVERALDEMA
jgi:uncharacterized protein YbjT (DUF2867 family)